MPPARTTPRNLDGYWKMEAANIVLVPAFAFFLGFPRDPVEALAIGLAAIATGGLLVVGALFWRGVDRRLRFADIASAQRALDFADRAEVTLLLACGCAVAATVAAWSLKGWTPAILAAALLTLLAILEYVNYYRRQLQHFDNIADLKRLFTGRGFKASHMARDLAARRRSRRG